MQRTHAIGVRFVFAKVPLIGIVFLTTVQAVKFVEINLNLSLIYDSLLLSLVSSFF